MGVVSLDGKMDPSAALTLSARPAGQDRVYFANIYWQNQCDGVHHQQDQLCMIAGHFASSFYVSL